MQPLGMHGEAASPHAIRATSGVQSESILSISRVVSQLDRAESFYRSALGFRRVSARAGRSGDVGGVGRAARPSPRGAHAPRPRRDCPRQFAAAGRAYPADSRSNDLWFQHLAIVVSDMPAEYAALEAHAADGASAANKDAAPPWCPISRCGPQTLPSSSGGVQAFKFRDPDGHPLELLWLPPGSGRARWQDAACSPRRCPTPTSPFLGIDHSALGVSSTSRSLAFYRALGMRVGASTLNEGPAQSALDGLDAARVEVNSLRPASSDGPGIELLEYEPPGRGAPYAVTDMCSDWIVAAASGRPAGSMRLLSDPDGHRLLLVNATTQ